LVEETGVPRENHHAICRKTLINVVSITPRHEQDSNSQF
jgi:hypothetical protein